MQINIFIKEKFVIIIVFIFSNLFWVRHLYILKILKI